MIELKNLSKTFVSESGEVHALSNISLTVNRGDIYGMIGMSGAGKSTLVRCINLLEKPTEGQICINGTDICTLSQKELRDLRRHVAMIFQGFHLLMQRTCLENICFPMELSGKKSPEARKKALELLELVGLSEKANAYPAELSGGQKQRIAIARALACDPEILLCDEATSALDPNTTHSILELIRDINRRFGITVIIITHQMSVVEEICNRVAILDGGRVVEEGDTATVFSSPVSAAAKKLVYPSAAEAVPASNTAGERVLRVIFNGAGSAATPLITKMAAEEGIIANILYASTRCIGDMVYGNMLLGLEDREGTVSRALAYLQKHQNVIVMEVEQNV